MIGGLDARVCVAMCSHGFKVNTRLMKQGLIPELMGGEIEGEREKDLGRRRGSRRGTGLSGDQWWGTGLSLPERLY